MAQRIENTPSQVRYTSRILQMTRRPLTGLPRTQFVPLIVQSEPPNDSAAALAIRHDIRWLSSEYANPMRVIDVQLRIVLFAQLEYFKEIRQRSEHRVNPIYGDNFRTVFWLN